MAQFRENPYGAFNFLVTMPGQEDDGADPTIVGGFAEVSGIGTEVKYSEYRTGVERFNGVRKIPNTFSVDDVTLKRGLVGSLDLFQWIERGMQGTAEPRQITIAVLDEPNKNTVAEYRLRNARPKKYTGPSLNAKGGGEVAMEELVLCCEGLDYA